MISLIFSNHLASDALNDPPRLCLAAAAALAAALAAAFAPLWCFFPVPVAVVVVLPAAADPEAAAAVPAAVVPLVAAAPVAAPCDTTIGYNIKIRCREIDVRASLKR